MKFSPLRAGSTALASIVSFAIATLLVGSVAVSCASMQAAAARDPQRCERDPNCKNHQRAFDCNTQCADDPVCMDRCNEVQEQTGTSAPH
jgi:hypothetical protein